MFGKFVEINKRDTAIIYITKNGKKLAESISKFFPNSSKFTINKETSLDKIFQISFSQFKNIIAIMATGIVVRKISTLIKNKSIDPAVVVMDDKGKFAISLISGHLGGGNELAEYISEKTGAISVITTATDVNKRFAVDEMVRKFGWHIENPSKIKKISSSILNNEKIAINIPKDFFIKYYSKNPKILKQIKFYKTLKGILNSNIKNKVIVSNLLKIDRTNLLIRPKNIYIGIGCNRGTSFEELDNVIKENLEKVNRAFFSINSISSIDIKSNEECLLQFGEKYKINLNFYSRDELNSVTEKYKESKYVKKVIGVKGVCEPAAILSAKKDLKECFKRKKLLPKIKQGNVTIAIQELLFS